MSVITGVNPAVVIAREDTPGDKRLVAYVVPQPGAESGAAALREQLQQELPDYMVPNAFVCLAALPLTANGKLDRHALPAPDQMAVASQTYETPVGEVEQAIAEIWQELLGLERVGRHDHFFALGGHSLMIISLIERLHKRNLRANVRTVFTAPTLSALATKLVENADAPHRPDVAPNLIPLDSSALRPEHLTLASLTQADIDSIVERVPGGRTNIQDIYPLASLQEGILFHHLLETEGDAYLARMVAAFDCRDRLDRFLQALQTVIDRHDILRSGVHWQGLDKPVQVVHRRAQLPVNELALSPGAPALPQLLECTDPRRIRLDLQQPPLLSTYVAEDHESGEWLLAMVKHHIIDDNQSLKLLLREIQLLLEGKEHLLQPPIPYRNFIAQLLTVSDADHEAYFRRQLGEVSEPTAPFGVLNVQRGGGEVNETHVRLDDALARRIREIARQQGVTPAVLFHVAWAQVLSRCSGQQDVVFGTVLSGRQQVGDDIEQVVGIFINTLPIRIRLAQQSVADAVQVAHQGLSELLEHEQASLSLAQRCSGVQLPLPLFTALLNYRHSQSVSRKEEGPTWPGMRMIAAEGRTNYPLAVSVDDLIQGFSLTAECVEGIDSTRVAGYLETAIQALVQALEEHPQQPISRLNVMPEAERRQLVVTLNAVPAASRDEQLIHQLFEAQAVQRPDAIALIQSGRAVSYGELNRQANRLAHHLRGLGVGCEDRVALHARRSPEFVIAVLATLKAGAAYVPLDPSYPADHLAYMLRNSAPKVVLGQGAERPAWMQRLDQNVAVLDLRSDAWHSCSAHNIDADAIGLIPENLAYVIHTSGSTGQPKGVMVEHRSVVNQITEFADYLGMDERDRLLQFASLSFDTAVEEIFATLAQGATLVLRTDEWLASAREFWALCAEHRISIVDLPAQFFSQTALERRPIPAAVRCVVSGGEAVSEAALQAWFSSGGHRPALFNTYGPTEATVSVTAHVMTAGDSDCRVLGRPIANTQLYVLDPCWQLLPIGASGELFVGGCQVARGYLGRAELTAERFIPDPFNAGGRLYGTGDMVRWRNDGTLEYLGRNDFQVKIRGFRVELGEVESKIAQVTGVSETVVIVQLASDGEKRLVAYYTGDAEPSRVRDILQQELPGHMVPSAHVRVDTWPTTPNGKIDRKALPAIADEAYARARYEAPQGRCERALAQLWSELLQVSEVGRYDGFFDLGGHSLLVIRMISQLSSRHGWDVSIRQVFETPTVAGLAAALAAQASNEQPIIVELRRGAPGAGAIYCIPGAGGRVAAFGELASQISVSHAIFGLQPRGMEEDEQPADRVQDMADEYLQALDAHGAGPCVALIGHSLGGMVAFEMARRIAERSGALPHV
ncbi:MAG: amino acid adenylation domain-containing protein, partial [Burkholderiales bacterium]